MTAWGSLSGLVHSLLAVPQCSNNLGVIRFVTKNLLVLQNGGRELPQFHESLRHSARDLQQNTPAVKDNANGVTSSMKGVRIDEGKWPALGHYGLFYDAEKVR